MSLVTRLLPALALLAGLFVSPGASGAERLLFVLGATDAGGKPVRLEVRDKAGLQAPKDVKPHARWRVLPGEAVRSTPAPAPRLVDLYAGTASSPELVARVLVRYFPSKDQWLPYYRITEEPAVVHQNGRWVPVMIGQGLPGLIVQHGGVLPNADGFFPRIEFSLTTGALAVSAWQVR